jgi:hypothetical protein
MLAPPFAAGLRKWVKKELAELALLTQEIKYNTNHSHLRLTIISQMLHTFCTNITNGVNTGLPSKQTMFT